MTVDYLEKLASVFADFSVFVAALFGGAWALYRFKILREGVPNPQLGLQYEVFPYNEENNLLVMTIRVGNVGKIDVYPQSITLALKSLPENFPVGKSPHWKDGEFVLEKFDLILDANPDMKEVDSYMLPPDDEYFETATCVVKKTEKLLMAKVHYIGKKDDSDFAVYKILRV